MPAQELVTWWQVIIAGFAGGGLPMLATIATLQVKQNWHRADIDRAHSRLDAMEAAAVLRHESYEARLRSFVSPPSGVQP